MEMLNNTLLAKDFWTILITAFGNWVTSYGWAIILFTIALKLVLSPLDFFQRRATAKQTRFMSVMQPELNALQEKYANDRERLNQETNKLYKKYNMNVGGMCLTMLIPMIVTMVVFFSLYGSLRSFGQDKLYSSYSHLRNCYVQAETTATDQGLTGDDFTSYVEEQVKKEYDKQSEQNSWLWVKNVWKGDTKVSQFVDFDDWAKHEKISDTAKKDEKDRYNAIVDIVEGDKDVQNGYFVLIIGAVVVSLLTQFLSAKLTTPKGQKINTMNKVMFAVIPLTMLIMASTSNVVFTLYIITNSIMSALISTVLTLISNAQNKGKDNTDILLPKKNVQVVEYSRNYKK